MNIDNFILGLVLINTLTTILLGRDIYYLWREKDIEEVKYLINFCIFSIVVEFILITLICVYGKSL